MDTRALKYFIRVAEEQSIGRAAPLLHLSPSALSRQIQALEEDFDAPLFVRTISGVELTAAGETLLRTARQILALLDQAAEEIHCNDRQLTGRLDIGVYGTAMFNIIPEIQQAFSKAHPQVEVVLHTMPRYQQFEALRQGRIQIAFDRYLPAANDLLVELVVQEPMVVAIPKDSELARFPAIRWSDFRDQPLIDDTGDPDSPLGYKALSRPYGFEPRVVQRAPDIISSIALVSAGMGITPVPVGVLGITFPNVVYRPLITDSEYTFDLYCAYRKGKQSPLLAAMLETVRIYRDSPHPFPAMKAEPEPPVSLSE